MWSKPKTPPNSGPPTDDSEPASPTRQKNPGRRVAQVVKLKPEFVDKYKEVHAHVWPEVLKEIKSCNIQDCTCPEAPAAPLPSSSDPLREARVFLFSLSFFLSPSTIAFFPPPLPSSLSVP